MLKRVRREDVQINHAIKQDGLSICLDCWRLYMDSDDRDLSASRMKLRGLSDDGRGGYESDPYGEQRKADMRIGEATAAMIDSLKQCHQWAIRRKFGIATVWNFPSIDYLDALCAAEEELEKKLRGNVDTAHVFA